MIKNISGIICTAVILLFVNKSDAQDLNNLKSDFKNPPASAWPRTWWHWIGSNITKDGITKDLEWMKRSGIAGFQLADVAAGSGQTVEKKIIFGTPEWQDALRHTAMEAERLDLEMAMFSSAGWSLTGGTWVKPQEAMKKLVWSETRIKGGRDFNGKLMQPPSAMGAGPLLANNKNSLGPFYADCAVIAFKTPSDEWAQEDNIPSLSSNAGNEDKELIQDNDISTGITIRPTQSKNAWIQLSYPKPFKSRAITIAAPRGIAFGRVMTSSDGINFSTLISLPGKSGYRGGKIRTYAFPETEAKYYRIEFTNAPPRPADIISEKTTPVDTAYAISEIHLHSGGRVNRWEDKAGFNFLFEYSNVNTPAVSANSQIKESDILDISSYMDSDGTLRWNVPAGDWTIMRFGYALTGAKNRPAIPAALGYEVDKLSKEHTESYIRQYGELLAKAVGPLYGKRLLYLIMDSWEAGIQNWTDLMMPEFKKRRGYDMTKFLPVLSGRIVGNPELSERFLWDFRRTLVDMFAENHYGTITAYLNKQGIKTYAEAGGVSLESIEDALLNKKYVDIPMGEFWVKDLHPSSMYYEDVRGAASASRVYGKGLVAAESFTGGNYESPYTLKKVADYWQTQGINRLVFHTSAHQPLDTKPGNAMVGTHLNRNITWAANARPLFTYLARNSYMLQQGTFVADVVYLLSEGAPSTMPFWNGGLRPELPSGYDFDYINTDVLLNRMSVSNNKLVLPDGLNYSVLVLPESREMSLPVLKKVKAFLEAGAVVVGPKPLKSVGLTHYPHSEKEFHELCTQIWADLDGSSRTQRAYGQGRIFWGMPLKEVLRLNSVPADVEIGRPVEEISWIHRTYSAADIYFVVNRTDELQEFRARFRVSGKDVELWHADNGEVSPASYHQVDGFTYVPIRLQAGEAVFVVFGKESTQNRREVPLVNARVLSEINGLWKLSFPANMGAPQSIDINQLDWWTNSRNDGVKYFSGTASYHKTFKADKNWLKNGGKLFLDLGDVRDIAEVSLNGKKLPLCWKPPFKVDITDVIKAGSNELEVKITNEWTNRLIGDNLYPNKKVLDSYIQPFGGGYQLQESGLKGPVKIISEKF